MTGRVIFFPSQSWGCINVGVGQQASSQQRSVAVLDVGAGASRSAQFVQCLTWRQHMFSMNDGASINNNLLGLLGKQTGRFPLVYGKLAIPCKTDYFL